MHKPGSPLERRCICVQAGLCLKEIIRNLFGTDDYQTLLGKYDTLQKISFDYAVVEKEKSINVIRFKGQLNKGYRDAVYYGFGTNILHLGTNLVKKLGYLTDGQILLLEDNSEGLNRERMVP